MTATPRCRSRCSLRARSTPPTSRSTTRWPARSAITAATPASTASRRERRRALRLTSSDPDERRGAIAATSPSPPTPTTCSIRTITFRGQWFDDLTVFWKDFAKLGPLTERHYDTPRATGHMQQFPEHGTLAAKVTVPAGATQDRPLRHLVELSARRHLLGLPRQARCAGARQADAALEELLRDAMGGSRWLSARDAFARWPDLAGKTLSIPRHPVRLVDACADDRRGIGTLALLRTATVIRLEHGEIWGWEGQHTARRLVRGLVHPCVELPAGAVAPVPGARAHAARNRMDLQPAALWRPDLPPEAAARLRLRHHRPLRRRPFRRHHQDLSRMAAIGRHRLARAATGPISSAPWNTPGRKDNPDQWDPGQTGILSGRQHQTLDMELFGPNSWLGSMYVAALLADGRMAEAVGDNGPCRQVRSGSAEAGADYIDDQALQWPLLLPGHRPRRQDR